MFANLICFQWKECRLSWMTCFPPSFIFVVVSLIVNFLGFAGEGRGYICKKLVVSEKHTFGNFLGTEGRGLAGCLCFKFINIFFKKEWGGLQLLGDFPPTN